jgi:hypothetical protein
VCVCVCVRVRENVLRVKNSRRNKTLHQITRPVGFINIYDPLEIYVEARSFIFLSLQRPNIFPKRNKRSLVPQAENKNQLPLIKWKTDCAAVEFSR